MLTANEKILDAFVRHQVRLISYGNKASKDAVTELKNTEEEVAQIILLYANRLNGKSLASKAVKQDLRRMHVEIRRVRETAWRELGDQVSTDLKQLIIQESDYVINSIKKNIPVELDLKKPKASDIKKQAVETTFEGATASVWLKEEQRADATRITKRVIAGLENQELITGAAVVASVVGTKALKYKDGVLRKSWPRVESIVNTAITNVQALAKRAVGFVNPDLIQKEYFVATLDGNTTFECAGHDGSIFAYRSGPIPPLHWRCRSIRIMLMEHKHMATRPFKPTTEKLLVKEYVERNNLGRIASRSRLPRGHKGSFDSYARLRTRELIGSIPAKVNFTQWMRRQSVDFQNEYFGLTRAELFRTEKLHVSRFTNRFGNTLRLDQL